MDLQDLKKNIFYRATIFIEDMGCFAPFGAKYRDNEIIDVVYDPNGVEIDSNNIVYEISETFSQEIIENKISAAAIAIDVLASFDNADGVSEKRDALCLKISTDGVNWSEEYFPYLLIEEKCVWR